METMEQTHQQRLIMKRSIEPISKRTRPWHIGGVKGSVQVLFMPWNDDANITDTLKAIIPTSEHGQAMRIASQHLQSRFYQRRAFRQHCASLASNKFLRTWLFHFSETTDGRPYLTNDPAIWFSFSSCSIGYIGAWSNTYAVGIDIEAIASNELDIINISQNYFSNNEFQEISELERCDQSHAFLKLWTLKEASLKSIGKGLPFDVNSFCFRLKPTTKMLSSPSDFGPIHSYEVFTERKKETVLALILRQRQPSAP